MSSDDSKIQPWYTELHEQYNMLVPHSEYKFRLALWLEEQFSIRHLKVVCTGTPRPFHKMRTKFDLAFLVAVYRTRLYKTEYDLAVRAGWQPAPRPLNNRNTK